MDDRNGPNDSNDRATTRGFDSEGGDEALTSGTQAEEADGAADLPTEVVDEVERLARLERRAIDGNEREAYAERREGALQAHTFTSRIREDGGDATLVVHPEQWLEDGVIRTDRIDDLSRAIEIPLEGTGDPDDWGAVDERNRELVSTVREAHGDIHGDNAAMLADFAGNHYAKPIESLSADELAEFRSEYVVRNAWPSEKQRDVIAESIELVYETIDEPVPGSSAQ